MAPGKVSKSFLRWQPGGSFAELDDSCGVVK